MDIEEVKKFIGKNCKLVLKNDYVYYCTIPNFENSSFCIVGKQNEDVAIDCSFISFIKEVEE